MEIVTHSHFLVGLLSIFVPPAQHNMSILRAENTYVANLAFYITTLHQQQIALGFRQKTLKTQLNHGFLFYCSNKKTQTKFLDKIQDLIMPKSPRFTNLLRISIDLKGIYLKPNSKSQQTNLTYITYWKRFSMYSTG